MSSLGNLNKILLCFSGSFKEKYSKLSRISIYSIIAELA